MPDGRNRAPEARLFGAPDSVRTGCPRAANGQRVSAVADPSDDHKYEGLFHWKQRRTGDVGLSCSQSMTYAICTRSHGAKWQVTGRCGVLFGAILCLLTTTKPCRHRPDVLRRLMDSQSVEAQKPAMARRVREASIFFPGATAVGFGSLRNGPCPPSQGGETGKIPRMLRRQSCGLRWQAKRDTAFPGSGDSLMHPPVPRSAKAASRFACRRSPKQLRQYPCRAKRGRFFPC
jgi:hypothetical protein